MLVATAVLALVASLHGVDAFTNDADVPIVNIDRFTSRECNSSVYRCERHGRGERCKEGARCIPSCPESYLYTARTDTGIFFCADNINSTYEACPDVICEQTTCPENEIFVECSRCESTCADAGVVPDCPKCVSKCQCIEGFSRNGEGKCVENCCPALPECAAPRQCGPNEYRLTTHAPKENGCIVGCPTYECVPYLLDGASCGGARGQCQSPSTCLPSTGPWAPSICGRKNAIINTHHSWYRSSFSMCQFYCRIFQSCKGFTFISRVNHCGLVFGAINKQRPYIELTTYHVEKYSIDPADYTASLMGDRN